MGKQQVRADDLHAGDWIEDPFTDKIVWVATRGKPANGEIRFLVGRGGGGSLGQEIFWKPDEQVTLLSRWPELPERWGSL